MKVSVSISCGENAVNHNNRKTSAPNVDENRSHLNVTYNKNDLQQLYDELFGKAWSDYLSGLPESTRKKRASNYLEHVKNLKNKQKPIYEVVVQIGNRYTCGAGLPGEEIALKILDEYARDFEKRNPHLAVLNMVLHRDEDTPHLHIDYIPVGDGYENGLSKRNSLHRALEQQGIQGDKTRANSKLNNWYISEKSAIAVIMGKYDWEPEVDSGRHLHHKSVETYKTIIAIVENEVSQLPEQIERIPYAFGKDMVLVNKKDLNKLEERAKLSIVNNMAIDEIGRVLRERADAVDSYVANRKAEIEKMFLEAKEAISSENRPEPQTCGSLDMAIEEAKRKIAKEGAKKSKKTSKTKKRDNWER